MKRLITVLMLAVTLLVAGGIGTAAAAPDDPAYVRLAHLSPDTPPVDVYLAAVDDPAQRFTATGVDYGSVSDYRALPAGTYTVAMRVAGAAPDSPPVIAATLTAGGGDAFTVAGTGPYAALGLEVLSDDLVAPPAGQAKVRVVNAAASAPSVSVAADPLPAQDVAFAGSTPYRTVPAGRWPLRVTPDGGPARDVTLDVPANSVHTVFLVDGPDGVSAQVHEDAAGPGTTPAGSIATGFGGAAGLGGGAGAPIGLLALGAAVAVGFIALRRVRTDRR